MQLALVNLLHLVADHLGVLAAIVASTLVLWKLRTLFRAGLRFISALARFGRQCRSNWTAADRIFDRLSNIEQVLGEDSGAAHMANIDFLLACRNLEFERQPLPAFECSSTGDNLRVTDAYRQLLDVHRDEDILGRAWINSIAPSSRERYLTAWHDAAAEGARFTCEVALQDPHTRRERGRWLVDAAPIAIKTGVIYTGRFIRPLDETARNLVTIHDWMIDTTPTMSGSMVDIARGVLLQRVATNECLGLPTMIGDAPITIPVSDDWEDAFPRIVPGLQVRRVDSTDSESYLSMRAYASAALPEMRHPQHRVRVRVVSGAMLDVLAGERYEAGRSMTVAAGAPYQLVLLSCMVDLVVTPACATTTPEGIKLDGLAAIVENT